MIDEQNDDRQSVSSGENNALLNAVAGIKSKHLKLKNMTYTEKKSLPLGVGDSVKHYDDGKDGHPEKWVNGVVTEIGDESFSVLWDDFKKLGWETEYEWAKVEIIGSQIFENGQRSSLKQQEPFRQPNRVDLMSNAEKAITLAMYVIEESGASEMLTNAGIKLGQARDLVYEHYRNEG